jgi:phosphoribosylglycinamide formyltransferase-1
MISLGILGSTRGTDMQAIIDAIQQKALCANIKIVLSNKKDAYILERARQHHLNAQFVDPRERSREAFDEIISDRLQAAQVNLIILIGYMRILSEGFVSKWQNKIINVHPSLLPDFAGGMDSNVHQQVLDAGAQETGCTVHIVTEKVDAGPILVQKKCEVFPHDTVETLKKRVQALEGQALIEAINLLAGK